MSDHVIGVDGGNSKTEVAVATVGGRLLAQVRGGGVDTPLTAPEEWRKHVVSLVERAKRMAGVKRGQRSLCAVYLMANIDTPAERRAAHRELSAAGLAEQTVVGNDTIAVLRAGCSRGWGVAVVAGAGINAVGRHPSGRSAGFLALGDYTGDRGGGAYVAIQALAAAVRSRDGRGPATVLAKALPAYYGMRTPSQLAVAIRRGVVDDDGLLRLAPLVLAAAAVDPVAARIVDDLADEVATMAGALIRRLHLTRSDVEVVLGGGILQAASRAFTDRVTHAVASTSRRAQVRVLDVTPVYGALAEAYDRVDATAHARSRARRALQVNVADDDPHDECTA
ncbi:MAG: N-acetylglucosamine kinase [Nocardioidaceae bacterium]